MFRFIHVLLCSRCYFLKFHHVLNCITFHYITLHYISFDFLFEMFLYLASQYSLIASTLLFSIFQLWNTRVFCPVPTDIIMIVTIKTFHVLYIDIFFCTRSIHKGYIMTKISESEIIRKNKNGIEHGTAQRPMHIVIM